MPRLNFRSLIALVSLFTLLLSACSASATSQAVSTDSTSPSTSSNATPASDSQSQNSAPVNGTQFQLVASSSEASYAVREQLASLQLPSDAIGKTNQINGAIVVTADGSIDSANSKFVVQAGTLKTDSSMRDGFVARQVLQASQYPEIVFVPKQVSGLASPLPTSGDISFKVTGDLTIRDVTKPVTWDVTGTVNGGDAAGTATTTFTFEDFNLTQPRVPSVLSIVDKITLTVKLTLKKAGS